MAARLIELGALLDGAFVPPTGAVALAEGDAIAWVETARGLLLHRVTIAGDVVARYQIVAPTEWNFHPRGALATELVGLSAPDAATLRKRVDMLVQSLDPCVKYEVTIGPA
jgi:Ni,Fe-hydrogenase I large subunit